MNVSGVGARGCAVAPVIFDIFKPQSSDVVMRSSQHLLSNDQEFSCV